MRTLALITINLILALPALWAFQNLEQRLDNLEKNAYNNQMAAFVCTEARYGSKGIVECKTYERVAE